DALLLAIGDPQFAGAVNQVGILSIVHLIHLLGAVNQVVHQREFDVVLIGQYAQLSGLSGGRDADDHQTIGSALLLNRVQLLRKLDARPAMRTEKIDHDDFSAQVLETNRRISVDPLPNEPRGRRLAFERLQPRAPFDGAFEPTRINLRNNSAWLGGRRTGG